MSKLSDALVLYCKVNNISARQIARDIPSLSNMTVSRFMKGKTVDSNHFTAILVYFMTEEQL